MCTRATSSPTRVVDYGDGKANVWCSSQGHFRVRSMTADVLGVDNSKVKVVPAEIGGGFGGKTTVYLEPIAAKLSEKSGKPVKLLMAREEVLQGSGPAPSAELRIKIGATNDGELTAIDGWMAYGVGAFSDMAGLIGAMSVASYKFPNLRMETYTALTNTEVGGVPRLRHRTPHGRSSLWSTRSPPNSAWTRSICG